LGACCGNFLILLKNLVMESTTFIEKIEKSELPTLLQIAKSTFINNYAHLNDPKNFDEYVNENFNLKNITAEFNNPETAFLFAKKDDEICGYLKLNWGKAQTDHQLRNALEIERIYILQAFQGQKIGKLLVDKALEVAKAKKVDWIWLGVWEQNPKAIGFYKKVGFESFGEHAFMMGSERQTDILMRKTIR